MYQKNIDWEVIRSEEALTQDDIPDPHRSRLVWLQNRVSGNVKSEDEQKARPCTLPTPQTIVPV